MFITKRIENVELETIVDDIFENHAQTYIMIVRVCKHRNDVLENVHVSRRVQIHNVLVENKFMSNFKTTIFDVLKTYNDINNENKVYELLKHIVDDHAIELIDEKQSSHDFIYLMFKAKLKVLKAYLDEHFQNDFIRLFKSSIDVSILFIRKKNDSLRLCVNYKKLNVMIIKNKYSLSFIDESLDRLNCVKRFTNLNLTIAYHKMRIKRDDE